MKIRSRLLEFVFVPGKHEANPRNRKKYVTMIVSIPKIEADWKHDSNFYIKPQGTNAIRTGHRDPATGGVVYSNRYADLKKKLASLTDLDQPNIGLNAYGHVAFNDGRHRFALLRDEGYTEITVSVPKEDAAEFKRRYGV